MKDYIRKHLLALALVGLYIYMVADATYTLLTGNVFWTNLHYTMPGRIFWFIVMVGIVVVLARLWHSTFKAKRELDKSIREHDEHDLQNKYLQED